VTRTAPARAQLQIVPGYTILVLDTNILLSSLSMVTSLVESLRWTVVIPLPAIMELDGLASNVNPLGDAAKAAIAFVASHVRSHADSLKVQTSRGNYLSSLSVRAEQVDFDDPDSWERNMDDLILKAAIWQDEHWVDRSSILRVEQSGERSKGTAKVVLLSLDRNRESFFRTVFRWFLNAFGFLSSPQGARETSRCR
jgi:protein SMG6